MKLIETPFSTRTFV